jgi:F-type H+-transporting ATPase subunit b
LEEIGLDLGLLISQIVNFGLLVALLSIFLYRPVLDKLQERARRIEQGVENAEWAKTRLEEADAHYEQEMERARQDAQEILERATRSAEQQRQEILLKARQEAHEIVLRAQQQAEREIQEREIKRRQQVIDLAMAAASRLLEEELDEEKHRHFIEEFISEAEDLP